ncbi:hypothetical protein CPB86DRAFT_395641 [Serendipita vermifera]|nr:hypothetical protein CPB86DRAFT_395641 [Serendipita vermifera]
MKISEILNNPGNDAKAISSTLSPLTNSSAPSPVSSKDDAALSQGRPAEPDQLSNTRAAASPLMTGESAHKTANLASGHTGPTISSDSSLPKGHPIRPLTPSTMSRQSTKVTAALRAWNHLHQM